MVTIDGSQGEGGGQVLRTALALSVITGAPFRIERIRGKRPKPGLLRQHLCAVRAAAAISDAEVTGDALGSDLVTFRPRALRGGAHTFAIGSAGSTMLVLQTVLWPLVLAPTPSVIALEGGTHNTHAPPFPFVDRTLAPLIRRMGPTLDLTLERWGFHPAGGGRVVAEIGPVSALSPLHLEARGPVRAIRPVAAVSRLPDTIADRELAVMCRALGVGEGRVIHTPAQGPGNVAWIEIATSADESDGHELVFTGFGERGRPAEDVAAGVVAEAQAWLDADVPVDVHLADQLLVPLALAGEGSYRTTRPSLHTTTNADVIRRFLDVDLVIREEAGAWRVEVRGIGARRRGAATRS